MSLTYNISSMYSLVLDCELGCAWYCAGPEVSVSCCQPIKLNRDGVVRDTTSSFWIETTSHDVHRSSKDGVFFQHAGRTFRVRTYATEQFEPELEERGSLPALLICSL